MTIGKVLEAMANSPPSPPPSPPPHWLSRRRSNAAERKAPFPHKTSRCCVVDMSKTIDVTLIGCAGLMGKQDNGFSDPVVHLNCSGQVRVSSVKKATNSPAWNETFTWAVPSSSPGVPLTLHVWNSPKFELGPDTKGAFLGTVTIEDVLKVIGKTSTLVLQKRSSRSNVSGNISVRVDDDASRAKFQSSASAVGQSPSGQLIVPTAAGAAAAGSAGSPPAIGSQSDSRIVKSAPSSISPADAALLDAFVSNAGNLQCADCDSKQVRCLERCVETGFQQCFVPKFCELRVIIASIYYSVPNALLRCRPLTLFISLRGLRSTTASSSAQHAAACTAASASSTPLSRA